MGIEWHSAAISTSLLSTSVPRFAKGWYSISFQQLFGRYRKNWYQKKVSEPVSEKFGTEKKSRNQYRNWFLSPKFWNLEDVKPKNGLKSKENYIWTNRNRIISSDAQIRECSLIRMEKRLMIPGVGQAGREQARCEDRPSCEGWQQPRWSSPRRTQTTGSWLPRGSHILVLNCGWVKSSKLCNENTNSMFIWHIWPFLTYYISCFMKNRKFSLKTL